MKSSRMEAFTDGVLAIVITIMVLELKVPHETTLIGLRGFLPIFFAYALSFVNVGLYWNNHHHLFQATEHIDGRVMWANLFLLFWLSLVPWVIRWADEAGFVALPVAAYGFVLGMAGLGYTLTQTAIIAVNGRDSAVAKAVGTDWKGKLSIASYAIGTPLAFWQPYVAIAIYVATAASWIIPDRRIEEKLKDEES